jgi:3-isopropylmalate dehydrogenase
VISGRNGARRRYRIGILAGDGIGPEVVAEGLKVLAAAADREAFGYELVSYPFSGTYYLETGRLVTPADIDEWRGLDAVLLGAIGHPDVEPGLVERSVILGLRFGLDLYANVRPVRLLAESLCPLKGKRCEDLDFVVVRENTEGLYSQIGGNLKPDTAEEVAVVTGVYTRHGTERVIRYAFELARHRLRRAGDQRTPRVTMVDKANAIRPQSIWTRTFDSVAPEYPDVLTDHAYVDACCMWLVTQPEHYDVIVTGNLFGDIVSDLGAALQGGLGLAASANIHPGRVSMFEPVHGSAPKYAGQNVASPLATIASVGLMLNHLGETAAAALIEGAIAEALVSGRVPSVNARGGMGTRQVGDVVADLVATSTPAEREARPVP